MREDLKLKDYSISIGYHIEYHSNDRVFKRTENPLFSLMFVKFKKYIWSVKNGWMCADMINGKFENHRRYIELKTALDSERF